VCQSQLANCFQVGGEPRGTKRKGITRVPTDLDFKKEGGIWLIGAKPSLRRGGHGGNRSM